MSSGLGSGRPASKLSHAHPPDHATTSPTHGSFSFSFSSSYPVSSPSFLTPLFSFLLFLKVLCSLSHRISKGVLSSIGFPQEKQVHMKKKENLFTNFYIHTIKPPSPEEVSTPHLGIDGRLSTRRTDSCVSNRYLPRCQYCVATS